MSNKPQIDRTRDAQLRRLAVRIATCLFIEGVTKRHAIRLVLAFPTGELDAPERQTGTGWCKVAVYRQVLAYLRRAEIARMRKERK